MPKYYQLIVDYFPNPMYKTQMAQATKALGPVVATLPGKKIMSAGPTTFKALFDAFVDYIHTSGNGLTWAGSGGGGGGTGLIDGDKTTGECAMFAKSLQVLAYAPSPYGLGVSQTDVDYVNYTGRYGNGFISNHPLAGLVRLRPNVANQELYLWSNHKIVSYQGTFWDPMYKTTYKTKDQMALYHIVEEIEIEGDTYFSAEATNRVGSEPGLRGVWFKESKGVNSGPSNTMPF
jgi:hypothetical protein